MICPGFLSRLRRILLALCLLILGPVGQAAAGDVRLAWDASPDTDLAGYVLVYGTSSRVYTTSVTLPVSATAHEVSDLPNGTYYFAVRAFDGNGAQSGYSNEVRVVVGTTVTPMSDPTISTLTPSKGTTAGGTVVTLSGTDFEAGVVVTFGETDATVTLAHRDVDHGPHPAE